jgi:hypothetical protein
MFSKIKFFLCGLFSKFCSLIEKIIKAISLFFKGIHHSLKFLQTYIVFGFSFLFLFHFLMLYGTDGQIIELMIAKPTVHKVVNYPVPTDGILTHNTNWNHLTPCGIYFNEIEEMKKAVQCVNKKVYPDKQIPKDTVIPRCFIISSSSPDVFSRDNVNFIPLFSLFANSAILGYFNTDTNTLFVVENYDAAAIYRHELQHYFLKLQG